MVLLRAYFIFLPLVLFFACNKDTIVDPVEQIAFVAPTHFPAPFYDFTNNPVTHDGFELGRRLFYDVRLSSDETVSCASCHHQASAFSDAGKPLSQGVAGAFGDRNSPSLSNLAWYPAFMWDGGVNHIEISSFAAIIHPSEFNMDFAALLNKLRAIPEYQLMFEKAFGSPGIDDQRFFYAMTQFTGLMISANSKFDQIQQGSAAFSTLEQSGFELFQSNCANCHAGVLFTDFSYRNNGLNLDFIDEGRMGITNNTDDLGKFRVPSLRNVALTAPYMHDGRFFSLDQVLSHYTFGIQQSATLDTSLTESVQLNTDERAAIVAFLNTLTDIGFTSNPKFSTPF